jgi:hypothetical protein
MGRGRGGGRTEELTSIDRHELPFLGKVETDGPPTYFYSKLL